MLPQAEHDKPTIPAPSEVVGLLGEYAAALVSVLEETPRHYSGPAYLPTRRAILATEQAAERLTVAAGALSSAGQFVATVVVPGGQARPVDLLADALLQMASACRALEEHQLAEATPLENRAGCLFLAEWVPLAAEDLEVMLAPVCGLLGRSEG